MEGRNRDEDAQELILCARYGEDDDLKELLKLYAGDKDFVNTRNEWGQSALQCAAANGNTEILKALLEAGANPSSANAEGNTPLHWAALTGQLEAVKLLVASKLCDVNARNKLGRTALDDAHDRGHSAVFDVLVESAAMPGKAAIEEAQKENEAAAKEDEEKEGDGDLAKKEEGTEESKKDTVK